MVVEQSYLLLYQRDIVNESAHIVVDITLVVGCLVVTGIVQVIDNRAGIGKQNW